MIEFSTSNQHPPKNQAAAKAAFDIGRPQKATPARYSPCFYDSSRFYQTIFEHEKYATHPQPHTETIIKDYIGNFLYENGELKMIKIQPKIHLRIC